MGALEAFVDLCSEFDGKARFAVVYLEEAHPTDGWMYPAVVHKLPQPQSLQARAAAASVVEAEVTRLWNNAGRPGGPPLLLVDSMENSASLTFGALPERLAILDSASGALLWLGGKGPEDYSVAAARNALEDLITAHGL